MQLPTVLKTGIQKLVYKPHLRCRVCSSKNLKEILDLGVSPLANDFKDATQKRSGFAPLKLMWCEQCTLPQTSVVVDRDVIYKNYPYVTSNSATMKAHFKALTEDLLKECRAGTVVEIGSNDGAFLKHCLDSGFKRAIGIDPADNLCDLAMKRGIPTHNEYFTCKIATELDRDDIRPDLIVARHVFCHIDDWHEAIHALGVLCSKHTLIAIEVPYFVDTLENLEWDQIYHEHLSFMTIKAMEWALKGSMLHIHAVNRYPIHGGAIVILLRRNDSELEPLPIPDDQITMDQMLHFSGRSQLMSVELTHKVGELVGNGRTVVGYGASAKASQWIHACGFTRKQINFVCDNTPQKQNKFMPGTDIPVVDDAMLTRELPDYAVLFSWNWRNEIIGKEKVFSEKGGHWIVPVPKLEIV